MTAPPIVPLVIRLAPRSKSATDKEQRSAAITRKSAFILAAEIPVSAPERKSESIAKMPRYLPGEASIYAIGENSAAHTA